MPTRTGWAGAVAAAATSCAAGADADSCEWEAGHITLRAMTTGTDAEASFADSHARAENAASSSQTRSGRDSPPSVCASMHCAYT